LEGIVAIFAILSVWVVLRMRNMFVHDMENLASPQMESAV
jgi:hypothetical protein